MIVSSFAPPSAPARSSAPRPLAQPQANPACGPNDEICLSCAPSAAPNWKQLAVSTSAQAAAASAGPAGVALEQPLRMLLIGPPGSGKGTQAKIVDRFFDVPHISTGQILRQEIQQQTELGKAAEPYVKAGQLVPDSIMLPMVDNRLEKEDSFILDGFPRSIAQAQHLDQTLSRQNKPLTCVATLDVNDEIVVKRLLERGREDDTEEIIRARLKVYHDQAEPVMAHYQQQQLLEHIPAEGKVPEVGFNLVTRLNQRLDEN
jgi:adenylate kinase